jgi:hypothetical protein
LNIENCIGYIIFLEISFHITIHLLNTFLNVQVFQPMVKKTRFLRLPFLPITREINDGYAI